jgi:hypothetical protein
VRSGTRRMLFRDKQSSKAVGRNRVTGNKHNIMCMRISLDEEAQHTRGHCLWVHHRTSHTWICPSRWQAPPGTTFLINTFVEDPPSCHFFLRVRAGNSIAALFSAIGFWAQHRHGCVGAVDRRGAWLYRKTFRGSEPAACSVMCDTCARVFFCFSRLTPRGLLVQR